MKIWQYAKFSLSLHRIGRWCNGNTTGFGSVIPGSNPSRPTTKITNQKLMKTNYNIRYAAHPEDAKHYDTARLRRDFLIETIFASNEVNMVYSMYDRMIVGGAMPAGEALKLEAIDPLKADFFTTRREIGIYNVGGAGSVKVGNEVFELNFKEALYIGRGERDVIFSSNDAANPAKFYFNSTTAHTVYPCRKITKQESGHLPLHGRAQGDTPHLDAWGTGRAITRMEHPFSCRHPQLHLHLGYGRREPRLWRPGLLQNH